MDHDRLGSLKASSRSEGPRELERVDAYCEPRATQPIDLGLGEEIARVDEAHREDFAGFLVGARIKEGDERIVLVARGSAPALH